MIHQEPCPCKLSEKIVNSLKVKEDQDVACFKRLCQKYMSMELMNNLGEYKQVILQCGRATQVQDGSD